MQRLLRLMVPWLRAALGAADAPNVATACGAVARRLAAVWAPPLARHINRGAARRAWRRSRAGQLGAWSATRINAPAILAPAIGSGGDFGGDTPLGARSPRARCSRPATATARSTCCCAPRLVTARSSPAGAPFAGGAAGTRSLRRGALGAALRARAARARAAPEEAPARVREFVWSAAGAPALGLARALLRGPVGARMSALPSLHKQILGHAPLLAAARAAARPAGTARG